MISRPEPPKHFVAPQHKFNIKMGRYVAGIIVGPMAVLVGVVARLVHLQAVPEGIIAAVQAHPAVPQARQAVLLLGHPVGLRLRGHPAGRPRRVHLVERPRRGRLGGHHLVGYLLLGHLVEHPAPHLVVHQVPQVVPAVQARPAVLLRAGGVQGRPSVIPAMFVKIISGFLKIKESVYIQISLIPRIILEKGGIGILGKRVVANERRPQVHPAVPAHHQVALQALQVRLAVRLQDLPAGHRLRAVHPAVPVHHQVALQALQVRLAVHPVRPAHHQVALQALPVRRQAVPAVQARPAVRPALPVRPVRHQGHRAVRVCLKNVSA